MSQENYYPVNIPLINYFFYKSPFVSDKYSLTSFDIANPGVDYNVDDIIVLSGGEYDSPAVLKVSGVNNAGQITSAIITNNGRYKQTPVIFTQLVTNGQGLSASFSQPKFKANILDAGTNIPLSGGFIYFYDDEDHTKKLNTYSDISDPENLVLNTNPIQLGASGETPLYYMDDRLYYIVVTDSTGDQSNPQYTFEHIDPAKQSGGTSGGENNNFISDGQFNFPIKFYKETDQVGEISKDSTFVSFGCEFLQEESKGTDNFVTFDLISGSEIEGHPIYEMVLESNNVSSTENKKDFRWIIAPVDLNAGGWITISAQLMSKNTDNVSTEVYIERFYGEDGSNTEIILLETFIAMPERQKFIAVAQIPDILGKIVGKGNYFAIIIRPGIRKVVKVGITNLLVQTGRNFNAVYSDEPLCDIKSKSIGISTDIQNAGLYENYTCYRYINGKFIPYSDTGTIVLCEKGTIQPFREPCDGGLMDVRGYRDDNIPLKRLYDVIGNTFGGQAKLQASVSSNAVTVGSVGGSIEKSAWNHVDSPLTIAKTRSGLELGLNVKRQSYNSVIVTFIDNFVPAQNAVSFPLIYGGSVAAESFNNYPKNGIITYWDMGEFSLSREDIIIYTIHNGIGVDRAACSITFNSFEETKIRHMLSGPSSRISSAFLDFADIDGNNRGNIQGNIFRPRNAIFFSVDGQIDTTNIAPQNINKTVPFLTTNTAYQNTQSFIDTIANPFTYTITATGSVNDYLNKYFLYSDENHEYVGYFKVDGVGDEPNIDERIKVPIPIFTGNDNNQIATAISQSFNSMTFNKPSHLDLPVLPSDSKLDWYINL